MSSPESSLDVKMAVGKEELAGLVWVAPDSNGLDRTTRRTMAERYVIGASRGVDRERGIDGRAAAAALCEGGEGRGGARECGTGGARVRS